MSGYVLIDTVYVNFLCLKQIASTFSEGELSISLIRPTRTLCASELLANALLKLKSLLAKLIF